MLNRLRTKKSGRTFGRIFLLHIFELTGIQLIVFAFLCHQLLMIALFDDSAIGNIHDDITILDGGKPVRNDEGSTAFQQLVDALLHQKEMSKRAAQHHFTVDGYTGFIFLNKEGKVYTPAYVYDVIQRITQSYNREEYFMAEKEDREPYYLPKISAHIFRHTFCTRLCEQESNIKVVQDIMGHRNFSTTMDIYTDVTRDKKVDVFKNLEGKMNL